MIKNEKRRLFMDLDGVMVDFNRRAAQVLRTPYPEKQEFPFDWGCRATGMSVPDFVQLITEPHFWYGMPLYPWAKDIYKWMEESHVGRWKFLTTATWSPDCAYAKTELVMNSFPLRPPPMIVVFGHKEDVCRPGDILVDDYEKNRNAWIAAGGVAFPWRDYTADHPDAWTQVVRMMEFVDTAMQLK